MIALTALFAVLSILGAHVAPVSGQSTCDGPPTQATVIPEFSTGVVPEYFTGTVSGSATVYACAQASVVGGDSEQGQAYVLGGATITLDGATERVTATLAPGVVQSAFNAMITVEPTGTATIVDGTQINILVQPSATVNVATATTMFATIETGGLLRGVSSGDVGVKVQGGQLDLELPVGFSPAVRQVVVSDGIASVFGDYATMFVGQDGQGYLRGANNECDVDFGGTCIIKGPTARMTVSGAQATGIALQGPGEVEARNGGHARIDGRGMVGDAQAGGTITVGPMATATVRDDGQANLEPYARNVLVEGGGVALIQRGGLVTSRLAATLVPQPLDMQLYTTVIGEDTIVYAEGAFQSGGGGENIDRRRARQTARASRCGPGRTECPSLHGRTVCVNTETDIFNCGGCSTAPRGVANATGVDCTVDADGGVGCKAGRCVVADQAPQRVKRWF